MAILLESLFCGTRSGNLRAGHVNRRRQVVELGARFELADALIHLPFVIACAASPQKDQKQQEPAQRLLIYFVR